MLNQGAVDFGLITLPLVEAKLEIEHLFWRQDVLIGAPGHLLLAQAEVTLVDLMAYPLLLLEPGSTSRQLLDQLFAAANLVPQVIDLGSIEVIKRYVAIDLGISIVPAIAIAEEVRMGRLQAREVPFLQGRAVGLVKRRTGYLSPASRKFLEMLHVEIANLDA